MNLEIKVNAFVRLGSFLKKYENISEGEFFYGDTQLADELKSAIVQAKIKNPWFEEIFVKRQLSELGENLTEENIRKWLSAYDYEKLSTDKDKFVAVIMAGNLPLVGFHDFMCVLIAGYRVICKMASDDSVLLPTICKILGAIEHGIASRIHFSDRQLSGYDAVIATGSNNSSRYFDYYFGKNPHIIRRNRNSVAVLTGDETPEQLASLADDILMYFGLGCRSVSKLFVPEGYDFTALHQAMSKYNWMVNHNKFANNYDYRKAIYLINQIKYYDADVAIIIEQPDYSTPISVLGYEYYNDIEKLNAQLQMDKELLQCIVSNDQRIEGRIGIGEAQSPGLNDYADGVDTIKFLMDL